MTELNFELDQQIDFLDLHNESARRQPRLIRQYGEIVAQTNMELKKLREKEKTIRSQIILEIKTNDPKATAQIIEATYRTDKRFININEDVINKEYDLAMAENAMSIIQGRKYSIDHAIDLMRMEYFSVPSGQVLAAQPVLVQQQEKRNAASSEVRGRRRRQISEEE